MLDCGDRNAGCNSPFVRLQDAFISKLGKICAIVVVMHFCHLDPGKVFATRGQATMLHIRICICLINGSDKLYDILNISMS